MKIFSGKCVKIIFRRVLKTFLESSENFFVRSENFLPWLWKTFGRRCEKFWKVSGKIKKSTPVVKKNNLARENVVKVSERVANFLKNRVPSFEKRCQGGVQKVSVDRGFQNLKKRPRSWKVWNSWNSWNSWKVWKFVEKCENVKFVKFVKSCEISSKKVPETLLIKGWLTSEFKKKSLFFTFEPKNPVTLSPKFRGRPSFWVKFFGVATFLDPLFSLFLKISQLFANFYISRNHTFSQNFTLFALLPNFTNFDPPQILSLSGFFEKVCVQIEIGVRLLWNFDWTRSRTTSVGCCTHKATEMSCCFSGVLGVKVDRHECGEGRNRGTWFRPRSGVR